MYNRTIVAIFEAKDVFSASRYVEPANTGTSGRLGLMGVPLADSAPQPVASKDAAVTRLHCSTAVALAVQ